MMYEMRRRNPGPTQGIFNLPHHVGMIWEAFDDAVEIQISGGDGIGNRISNLQIRSPISKKVRHSNHSAIDDATPTFLTS